jgi:ubiquitin
VPARCKGFRTARQLEVGSERAHQQKRRCEQHRARDREPGIVAMLTEETSHTSPIGA